MQNRQELEDKVLKILYAHNKNRRVANEIVAYMVSKNIGAGKAIKMFNQNIAIQMFTDMELRLMTIALYQALGEPSINPNKYFTIEELNITEEYKAENTFSNNMLVFNNTDNIQNNQFVCSEYSLVNLVNAWSKGIITVNKHTQKDIVSEIVNSELVERTVVNLDSMTDIKNRILSNKFYPMTITLNILNNNKSSYTYNAENRTLQITVGDSNNIINILDNLVVVGGALKALEENPNINGNVIVHVLNFTEKEAKSFIEQSLTCETKETVIIREQNMLDKKVIDVIKNTKENNLLYEKIGEDLDDVIYNNKYVSMETLLMALNYNFSYTDIQETNDLADYLITGFNTIIDTYKPIFENISESRLNSYVTDNNAFIAYMAILARLKSYNLSKWEGMLKAILSDLDLSRENKFWKEIHLHYANVNMPLIKIISDYFSKVVIERV